MLTAVDYLNLAQRDLERLFAACVIVTPNNTVQESGWLAPEIIHDGNIRRFWFEIKASIPATMDMGPNSVRFLRLPRPASKQGSRWRESRAIDGRAPCS